MAGRRGDGVSATVPEALPGEPRQELDGGEPRQELDDAGPRQGLDDAGPRQGLDGGDGGVTGGSAEGAGCRPMRADARRNYARLLDAARAVFAREGAGASMEAIAREAGVGVGTLYRHFPKRVDLVQAVYRDDVDELVARSEGGAAGIDPWSALASWLEGFVNYARNKKVLIAELQDTFDKQPELKLQTRERLNRAMSTLLARAQSAGVARTDIDGDDLMALVSPMCIHAHLTEGQAERLVAMILDGLKAPS